MECVAARGGVSDTGAAVMLGIASMLQHASECGELCGAL